jgi:hypothetical protein
MRPAVADLQYRYHQRRFRTKPAATAKETTMCRSFSCWWIPVGIGAVVASAVISESHHTPARAQAQASTALGAAPASALKTSWGEPDLQGIWTDEFDTPLQRPDKYASQEFFTEAQRQELDNERSALVGRRVTERELAGAYNFAEFLTTKRTGARTSLIVDPPNGRIPPRMPEALKAAAADREFYLALLQSTETCKKKALGCTGGRYDPTPSPRLAEPPPRYNTVRINRYDGPEDGSLGDRCLTRGLPEFANPFGGSFRRIVQTPGGVSIYYDVGQGQGWQRNIVMNGSPHLPAAIRQWFGDSRGHWEGDTLVIDVTNFSSKTDFLGARESLHLLERWTRSSPTTLEYAVTIEDPIVWTRHGPSSRSSPSRATRRTESITSRAALKETMAYRDYCMDDARKSSPLQRDEVLIRQPEIPWLPS